MSHLKNNNGFSLVELMIVVGVIAILAVIAVPAYNGYMGISKKKVAENVLESIPVLLETYRAENGMMCPVCDADGNPVATYTYKEKDDGTIDTDTLTAVYRDFKAKSVSADVSLYDYQISITVSNCGAPACEEVATLTATPVTGRGAPSGTITKTYE